MTTKRLEATVRGRVQGVSFRYYTRLEANRLELTGWVRNERDGSVSVVAEGTEEKIDRFLDFLHRGSPGAQVAGVTSNMTDHPHEYAAFDIRWT